MIYRDRKYLSVLTLTEDRDYVTYEELIQVLEQRPSNAIYIERDGILCGLISFGRIERNHDEKTRRVPFNKKFSSVYPEGYWRARQIFRDKEKINMLPVVSVDRRLLGDYVRWKDLICRDHAELLCKDSYTLQGLKENIQNTVFVKPAVREANRDNVFSWWRQALESEGIHLQSIHHEEIKDYLNVANTFLFVDEDEKHGIEVLHRYLHCNKISDNIEFITIADYFYRMRERLDLSFLETFQDQGIFVLGLDYKETGTHFLTVMRQRMRERSEEYQVGPCLLIPEELKKSFGAELYNGVYKEQRFPLPVSYQTQAGILYFSDEETEFLHIQNGERLTVNQPEKYDRCIYLYGPCFITGLYVPDQYTIPSLLQGIINQAGFSCKVVNRGFIIDSNFKVSADRIQSASFKKGDIVILDHTVWPMENCSTLNLIDVLEKHNAPLDWFVDSWGHCNHKANQVYAQAIFEELLPVLRQPSRERISVEQDHDYIDHFYLNHYFSNFDHISYGTVGSIVMNCNPFTLGHRFLIEEALKTVDFLIIFVVEEDESLFSFQERFAMVCQGTSDFERVMVVPSGPYILSKNTFPEYFEKINDEDLKKNTEDDITLFAEKIAPKLGITYRFVGEEREDKVTNEYNEAMKRILPRYGIRLVEIPRKANGQSVISASQVRRCLELNQLEELDKLVPTSTKRLLFFEYK